MYRYLRGHVLFRFADIHLYNSLVLYTGYAVSTLWKTYLDFPSSSAQWLHLLLSCSDKMCQSHPRLVDLSCPVHQQCSKTFSYGSSQVWGVGPGKSDVYEQDNTWPWPRHVSRLARNVLYSVNANEVDVRRAAKLPGTLSHHSLWLLRLHAAHSWAVL